MTTEIELLNHAELISRPGGLLRQVKGLWSQYDSKSPQPSHSLLQNPKRFTPWEAHKGNSYVVMMENGNVVAVATILVGMTSQKSFIQIEDFIVHPAHRRKGHGREMMDEILKNFDHHDGTIFFAQAEVHPSREAMIGLLESFQFVRHAAATHDGIGAVDVYRYNFFDPD